MAEVSKTRADQILVIPSDDALNHGASEGSVVPKREECKFLDRLCLYPKLRQSKCNGCSYKQWRRTW